MSRIVISYRRDDAKWIAGRIFDQLNHYFGAGNVFLDLNAIPAGTSFPENLRKTVARCEVLLVLIGPKWFEEKIRLWEETDWVRIEILTALEKRIPILPILIDGVRMPHGRDIPSELHKMLSFQAAEIDGGTEFQGQMLRLAANINEEYLGRLSIRAASHWTRKILAWIIRRATVLLLISVTISIVLLTLPYLKVLYFWVVQETKNFLGIQ